MNYKITGYKPEKLFHFFEDISAIPRGSANEKAISDYLVAFAEERYLWYHRDALFNVIIKKPASAGAKKNRPLCCRGIRTWYVKNSQALHMILQQTLWI